MTGYTEKSTVQKGLIDLLVAEGWTYIAGADLPRTRQNVIVEQEVRDAFVRLNPSLAPRVDVVLAQLRKAAVAAAEDGLMAANEAFTSFLRGRHTVLDPETNYSEPYALLDFVTPANNSFIVSDEVTYMGARFDLVLWVNGFPLVVGETKTPVSATKTWRDGARDIHDAYETHQSAFFTPNVLSFATEGKDFRYAGVRTPLDYWHKWGDSALPATIDGWDRVRMSASGLLAPRTVLNLLEHYAMFERSSDDDGIVKVKKILPRYFQYEAVEKIVARVTSEPGSRGLIYHTQGSGKTLTMSWVAIRLVLDPRMKNPTVVAVADRTQLVRQTWEQFAAAGLPAPIRAESVDGLQSALSHEQRGIISTTVHKFAGAGILSERRNIILLVDEAHRTQEGALGAVMRNALPNAHMYGFTGTPIADLERNTFKLFGDERDEGRALGTYNSDRSIADGTTVPMRVVPRPVRFELAKEELDAAYDALAEDEGLTDEQKRMIAAKVANTRAVFHNPKRVRQVVEDIVTHFYASIDPLGMKAQIVVADQELCVEYARVLREVLDDYGSADEAAVVISATGDKAEFEAHKMSEAQEETVLDRFRTLGDPLKFLIVTAKLGTGFNAPIEGVLYLDKPMKLHTLFQTITRTNRPWRNDASGFTKAYGTIVDYVGLGQAFARAIAPTDPDHARREIETDGLLAKLEAALREIGRRFVGIDRADTSMTSLQQAMERLPQGSEHRAEFRAEFLFAQGLWETLAPDERLESWRDNYRWYAAVFQAVPTAGDDDELVWERLAPKTRALVHQHMTQVRVDQHAPAVVIADAETIQKMVDKGELPPVPTEYEGKSADEIVDSLTDRIKSKLAGSGPNTGVYRTIAERLERLREIEILRAQDSIDWLTRLFEVATDLKDVEEQDDAGLLVELPDPHIGMLTRIFEENTPPGMTVMIADFVAQADKLVHEAAFDRWAEKEDSQREVKKALRRLFTRHRLPVTGEPFDSAWTYILKHY